MAVIASAVNKEQAYRVRNGVLEPAPRGLRFLADIFDFVNLPWAIGALMAHFLRFKDPGSSMGYFLALQIVLVFFRDAVLSPGRYLAGLSLVSQDGSKPAFTQVLVRNIFLLIPSVFIAGALGDFARLFIPSLLWRRIWYGSWLTGLVLVGSGAFRTGNPWLMAGTVGIWLCLIAYLFYDRKAAKPGTRLLDDLARTRVILRK